MHYLFESTAARLAQGPQLKVDTTPSLMMEESLALVRTLNWKIVTPLLIGLHSLDKKHLFTTEMLETLTEAVQTDLRITAVFISLYQILPAQRIEMEARFKVPVIDRYSLGKRRFLINVLCFNRTY